MTPLDHQTDYSCQGITKIAADPETHPELLNLLDDITIDYNEFQKLSSNQFADPIQRRYPINNRGNTILSKVYFESSRDQLPEKIASEIEHRLDTYLELHSIPDDIFTGLRKQAAATDDGFEPFYLLPTRQLCKVASVEAMHAAQEAFEKQVHYFPINDRVEFSQTFVKHSSEMQVPVTSKHINKYAALLNSDLSMTKELLEYRALAAMRTGKSGDSYRKIATELDKIEVKPDTDELKKLAEVIYGLDQEHGFDVKRYDRFFPCSYSTVFNKEALDEGIANGSPKSEEDPIDPASITKADLIARFGEGVLDGVENEDGELDKEAVKDVLKASGVKMVGAKDA